MILFADYNTPYLFAISFVLLIGLLEIFALICGHRIPAGTGLRQFDKLIVGSREDYERIEANKKNILDIDVKDSNI